MDSLRKAEREGRLRERVKFLSRYSVLIVDEIGYLPVGSGGGNQFFQLVNACYERCAMIMTGNRGFGEWGPTSLAMPWWQPPCSTGCYTTQWWCPSKAIRTACESMLP